MKDADYSSSITYNSGIKTPKEEKEPPVAIVAISTLRSMRFIALSSFLCKKRKKNRSFIILPPINHRRFFVIIIHNAVIIPNNTQFVQVFLQIFLDFFDRVGVVILHLVGQSLFFLLDKSLEL